MGLLGPTHNSKERSMAAKVAMLSEPQIIDLSVSDVEIVDKPWVDNNSHLVV
jgi:hypothetical protein